MDINVNVNSKAVEKLLEVVAEGVGVTANHFFHLDVSKIKRIGEAEAEVEKRRIINKAEAVEGSLEIFARAEKRFLLEQFNKQINLENIVVLARDSLIDSGASDTKVDPDWSRRFISIAQDVSREDIQSLLANILANEVKQPNSFSLRALDFVNSLSRDELLLFAKIAPLVTKDGYVYISKDDFSHGFAHISYSEILELMELDFIKPTLEMARIVSDVKVNSHYILSLRDGALVFGFTEDATELDLPVLQLSRVASELQGLIDMKIEQQDTISNYVAELEQFYRTKNMTRLKNKLTT